MDFPSSISFTLTNRCNLRCRMCGQWSQEGYMHHRHDGLKTEMDLPDWKRLVDELAAHHISSVLLRGGEPFLFPGIIELLRYINSKGIFVSIDTNGTLLDDYAADVLDIGKIHLTISMDGPAEVHDRVRGVVGTWARVRAGLARLDELETSSGQKIGRSLNFTISPDSVGGLGDMPDVARSLSVRTISIVPYYYFPAAVGQMYEQELQQHFGCAAFSWRGFHHEGSGVDWDVFQAQYRKYLAALDGIYNYPYMPWTEQEYQTWFADPLTPVGPLHCSNVDRLIDIQPNGDANFCVDFPDYTIGNVKTATIAEVWNGERAARFRAYRHQQPLAVCYRCGAKYMSEIVA